MPLAVSSQTAEEVLFWVEASRAPRLRTMAEFAEQEIIVADGKFEDARFSLDTQPWTRLLYVEIDSGWWTEVYGLGPRQSGKTLCFFVVPSMYYLFELRQNHIIATPDMETFADKWRENLKPAIARSQYGGLLPEEGSGSRGSNKISSLLLGNGVTLKIYTGGSRRPQGFTAPSVTSTEIDGWANSPNGSNEADKLTMIKHCTDSYEDLARIWNECVVTDEMAPTWQGYQKGSKSRIACPCPHCREHVTPEREHLLGWQDAESELAARRLAYFACPSCGKAIDDKQRLEMNRRAKLVHKGQTIDKKGKITGPMPETRTLGFRWNAFNNVAFWSTGEIGAREWRSAQSEDSENVEREMCQYVWAMPYRAPDIELSSLVDTSIARRMLPGHPRGIVPAWADVVTVAIDLHKFYGMYEVVAWAKSGRSHMVDYGEFDINSRVDGVEAATERALREFLADIEQGWKHQSGGYMQAALGGIDSGYSASQLAVYRVCQDSNWKFYPIKGQGISMEDADRYRAPKELNQITRHIGLGYHVNLQRLGGAAFRLMHVDVDHWKTFVHERLTERMPEECSGDERPGEHPMTLYWTDVSNEHRNLARQLTAEKAVQEFVENKGNITVWKRMRRDNHGFDCAVYNAAVAHFAGVRLGADLSAMVKQPGTRPSSWFRNQQRRV